MLAQGGKLSGEQVFTDVYWDAEECRLTERDWWLRSRAGRWELKASTEVVRVRVWCLASGVLPTVWATLPPWIIAAEDVAVSFARTGSTPSWILCLHQIPSLAAGDMGEGVTAYREITSAWQIARELADAGFLGEPETNILKGSCLDERALKDAGFQAFASFRTNREKIRWVRACGFLRVAGSTYEHDRVDQ